MEAGEDLLEEMRYPIGLERETRVYPLKNWRKMISERGAQSRSQEKARHLWEATGNSVSVVRKFNDYLVRGKPQEFLYRYCPEGKKRN